MKIRILLADDHTIIRKGLRSLLERESDIEVVSDLEDGRAAVEAASQTRPDIVIMDISMPSLNGIEATRQITSAVPTTKVIGLSMHGERKFVGAMLRAGASGYVLKNDVTKELMDAIRRVMSGRTYLSPSIAGDIVRHYVRERPPEKGAFADLSGREREVLQLIAEGRSTKEAAAVLHLSEKTIAAHREHIMAKLNLHTVVDLTRYALREGISEL